MFPARAAALPSGLHPQEAGPQLHHNHHNPRQLLAHMFMLSFPLTAG